MKESVAEGEHERVDRILVTFLINILVTMTDLVHSLTGVGTTAIT